MHNLKEKSKPKFREKYQFVVCSICQDSGEGLNTTNELIDTAANFDSVFHQEYYMLKLGFIQAILILK